MHDALALAHEGVVGRRAKGFDILVQRQDLLFADRVRDAGIAFFPAVGGRVVVSCGHNRRFAPRLATRHAQTFVGLWAGDFVHQMAVYVEHGGAVVFGVDGVFIPDFVVKRACHVSVFLASCALKTRCLNQPILLGAGGGLQSEPIMAL